jgi:hypothetical protein
MTYAAVATALLVMPLLYAMAFSVAVALTVTGPPYTAPTVSLGVLPSVVYRMFAPAVALEIATVCAAVYVPAAGLNVGVSTTGGMTYTAVATTLLVIPLLYAMARSVVVALTVTGPL